MKRRFIITTLSLLLAPFFLLAQENYKTISKQDSAKYYFGQQAYEVVHVREPETVRRPKNVIFLIGDGMGVAQIYSGMVANHGDLNLSNFKNIGFQKTYSASDFVTDSGAAGTALASGTKTYNGAIGVDMDRKPVENIREKCEHKGMATGVVSTSAVTHATPASFMAHEASRNSYEAIAADFLDTDVDVFIGGGYKFFAQRADGRDLTAELKNKGYKVVTTMEEAAKVTNGKLAALVAPEHIKTMLKGRGDMLPLATKTALNILGKDKDGFFIMIEGSQIDWGGHQNNTSYIATEMMDFDRAIGEAIKFAANDKNTLVIVTADHETGGFAINGGDLDKGNVLGGFTTGNHTGVMIPVFAFGPGSEAFRGFYENTDIPKKIMQLLGD